MYLPRNKQLKENSQNLRKKATKEENHLWYDFLKNYPIQFNRQKIIGKYIVDFYCSAVKLVVEIDGAQHYEADTKQYDKERTDYFNIFGVDVIRFSNIEVNELFEGVCNSIDKKVRERCTF